MRCPTPTALLAAGSHDGCAVVPALGQAGACSRRVCRGWSCCLIWEGDFCKEQRGSSRWLPEGLPGRGRSPHRHGGCSIQPCTP